MVDLSIGGRARGSTGRGNARFQGAGRHGWRDRQQDSDRRSAARRTLDLELAAMELGERLHEGQTEAGTLVLARMRVVDLPKRLERKRRILGAHADPGITNLQADPI